MKTSSRCCLVRGIVACNTQQSKVMNERYRDARGKSLEVQQTRNITASNGEHGFVSASHVGRLPATASCSLLGEILTPMCDTGFQVRIKILELFDDAPFLL